MGFMMKKNKKILYGVLSVVFVLLMMPVNPAIDIDVVNNVETRDDETGFLTSSYKMSEYWGNEDMPLTNGTGFFDTYQDDNGTWWFVDPEGYAFYSAGVAVVNSQGAVYNATVMEKYGSHEEWANATRDRLKNWGFNSLGAWSLLDIEIGPGGLSEMPYTIKVGGCKGGARIGWQKYVLKNKSDGKRIPDVFDDNWWKHMDENLHYVEGIAERLKVDPWLIGYWLDNEMHWGSNHPPHDQNTLLETYLSVPYEYDQPGKNRVVKFLIDRYEKDGIKTFNRVWNMNLNNFNELYNETKLGRVGWKAKWFIPRVRSDIDDFTQLVAHTYFKNMTEIVRKKDPNHLILGVRFHLFGAPKEVIEECGNYCDVVSINYYCNFLDLYDPIKYLISKIYGKVPLNNWMKSYYDIGKKPLIVGEYGSVVMNFSLLQQHLSNVYRIVLTEKNRADYFEGYARNCLNAPYVVGYHWFPYVNNENCGIVDLSDEPYEELVDRMTLINNMCYELHNS
jgi:hypothetical protein